MVTIVAFATYTEIQNHRQMSDLTRRNLEVLLESENDGYDCVLRKDDCDFMIGEKWQIDVIAKKMGLAAGLKVGDVIDLSSGTQLYKRAEWFNALEAKVRCGQDITCNMFLRQLGLIY